MHRLYANHTLSIRKLHAESTHNWTLIRSFHPIEFIRRESCAYGKFLQYVTSTQSLYAVDWRHLYTEKFHVCTKFSAYADVRPVRSEHAMHTLCERSARPRRGRRTLTLVDTKWVDFTTSPLRVGSEFWTFCHRTVCVLSAYAYRIKSIAHLLAFSLRALIVCRTYAERTRSVRAAME